MEFFEPIGKLRISVVVLGLLVSSSFISNAQADYFSKDISAVKTNSLQNLFFSNQNHWSDMIEKAQKLVDETYGNGAKSLMSQEKDTAFEASRIVGDNSTTTVKFEQRYQNLEVINGDTFVHFYPNGVVQGISSGLNQSLSIGITPSLTAQEATEVVSSSFGANVLLEKNPVLKLIPNKDGIYRLAYEILTKTSVAHEGHLVFVDALNGTILLQAPRMYDANIDEGDVHTNVYRADTEAARKADRIASDGSPADIDLTWYTKVIDAGNPTGDLDASSKNASENSKKVYDFYKENFNRDSFDDKGSKIVSVVHIGKDYNNAFWTSEFEIMGYGDGDGKKLTDLTSGLDVAAHEITHAVTETTAKLIYSGESGALNESYSDFFGKIIDSKSSDWLIGATVVGPKLGRRALRNMINPEEFKQPGTNDSALKAPTNGSCWRGNDYCGVHKNSGIPNHAGALIAEAIGKTNAARLYYNVLTQRLKPDSDFASARASTLEACGVIFGADSKECASVKDAYDTVKM